MKPSTRSLRLVVALSLLTLASACAAPAPPADDVTGVVVETLVAETDPIAIDARYHSMEGPWQRVVLDSAGIGWITGFRTEVVDAASGERLGDEFFCHSQIQLATSARLAVAATGIDEIRFPEGFGLPIDEIVNDMEEPWNEISLLGMVLNNHGSEIDGDVKLLWQTELQYQQDEERVQISETPVYSSAEGFVMYPDHEYEIESVYDNRGDAPVDAMAVMYLYHHPLRNERITYPIPRVPQGEPAHH